MKTTPTNPPRLRASAVILIGLISFAAVAATLITPGGGGGGAGEANTASNLGESNATVKPIFTTKAGVDLPFFSLEQGANVTLSMTPTSIVIAATGGSGSSTGFTFATSQFLLANGTNVYIIAGASLTNLHIYGLTNHALLRQEGSQTNLDTLGVGGSLQGTTYYFSGLTTNAADAKFHGDIWQGTTGGQSAYLDALRVYSRARFTNGFDAQAGVNLTTWKATGMGTNSDKLWLEDDLDVDGSIRVVANLNANNGEFNSLSVSNVFVLPIGAAPTTDAFGELAGDDNAWASGRGALQFYDGTANTRVVATQASDTPSNGQVPKWNTGGTITWEDDTGTGGSGGTNYAATLNNGVSGTITVDAGHAQHVTISSNGSFQGTISGATASGHRITLTIVNSNLTANLYYTNSTPIYDPNVRSNITTLLVVSNSTRIVTLVSNSATGRWQMETDAQQMPELRFTGILTTITNADGSVVFATNTTTTGTESLVLSNAPSIFNQVTKGYQEFEVTPVFPNGVLTNFWVDFAYAEQVIDATNHVHFMLPTNAPTGARARTSVIRVNTFGAANRTISFATNNFTLVGGSTNYVNGLSNLYYEVVFKIHSSNATASVVGP